MSPHPRGPPNRTTAPRDRQHHRDPFLGPCHASPASAPVAQLIFGLAARARRPRLKRNTRSPPETRACARLCDLRVRARPWGPFLSPSYAIPSIRAVVTVTWRLAFSLRSLAAHLKRPLHWSLAAARSCAPTACRRACARTRPAKGAQMPRPMRSHRRGTAVPVRRSRAMTAHFWRSQSARHRLHKTPSRGVGRSCRASPAIRGSPQLI